jgi:hypothetical protein
MRATASEMCISFTKLGEEQCEVCVVHEAHAKTHGSDDEKAGCTECIAWQRHFDKAERGRELYREDAMRRFGEDFSYRSVDLQKVIMLPRMPGLKTAIFTGRIIAFHETFASLGDKKANPDKRPNIYVAWNEGIAGRSAGEYTSTFYAAIKQERDVKHFVYWLDNCSGQNKNWTLFSALTILVNSDQIEAEDVTLKFFEPGHTFMSADSVHAGVE